MNPPRPTTIWRAAAIFLGGLVALLPALRGDWLWDDNLLVTDNPLLQSFSGLVHIWFAPLDYAPLTSTALWLLWQLCGDAPLGYHLASLALHLAGAFLIWRLLDKLGLRWGWLGGLLFAVHPLAVESVAWISEIKNTLSLPFYLLAMEAYLDYDQGGKKRNLHRSLLFYLAGMLAKSTGILLPAILLLYAWWKHGHLTRKALRETIPFWLLAVVLGAATVWFQDHRAIGGDVIETGGFFTRLAGAGGAACFYLGKFLLPADLLPLYPQDAVAPGSVRCWLSLPVLAGLAGWAWARRATWGRHVLLGLGFFLLAALPILGLVKMSYQRYTLVADHFAYLPMIGLVGLAVAGAEAAWRRLPARARPVIPALATAAVLALIAASNTYAAVFRDQETLWLRVLAENPGAWVAHNNLGNVLLQRGQSTEAMAHYRRALQLQPDYVPAHDNLGLALVQENRLPEAIAQFQEALRLKPDYAQAHNNLGLALAHQGRFGEAAAQFGEALRLAPGNPQVERNLEKARALDGPSPVQALAPSVK